MTGRGEIDLVFLLHFSSTYCILIMEGMIMKTYLDIIDHFGYRNQLKKLHEECFEFIEAVDNYEDLLMFVDDATPHDIELTREFIIEEMGDMLILLTQFIAKYHISKEELDATMDFKLDRTVNRINSGYYEKNIDNE